MLVPLELQTSLYNRNRCTSDESMKGTPGVCRGRDHFIWKWGRQKEAEADQVQVPQGGSEERTDSIGHCGWVHQQKPRRLEPWQRGNQQALHVQIWLDAVQETVRSQLHQVVKRSLPGTRGRTRIHWSSPSTWAQSIIIIFIRLKVKGISDSSNARHLGMFGNWFWRRNISPEVPGENWILNFLFICCFRLIKLRSSIYVFKCSVKGLLNIL